MARLDEFCFGYYDGRCSRDDAARMTNTLLRLGICSTVTPDGRFTLRRKDKRRFLSYATSRIRFELGAALGVYGYVERNASCGVEGCKRNGNVVILICVIESYDGGILTGIAVYRKRFKEG